MSRSRVVGVPMLGWGCSRARKTRPGAEARLGVRVRRGGVRERELLHGRIVARDAVAPSTSQETAKQVSETGPAWEGACARRGGGREAGHVRGGVDGRRRGRARMADARRGGGDARGERREGARTVHVAKVRASIANAVEVQTRRAGAGAGAGARARPARGAARDAIAELDRCDDVALQDGPRRQRPGRPRPRRDEMRSDGYGVGGLAGR